MTETAHSKALFYVLTAGMLWSFGALTIRYMVDPQNYRWQYLFFRGLTVAAILCICLIVKDVGQFATVALAGFLCAILTASILFVQSDSVLMPNRNIYLSMVHGTLIGVGLMLFSLGAKYFPAAELNLLSLVEVVGGVIWVYLPIFGINEVPSMLTVVGGCIVSGAILLDSVGTSYKSEVVKVVRN